MLAIRWRSFLAKHHGRTPVVLRDVVREPLVTASEAFDAMRTTGDDGPVLRVYDGARIVRAPRPSKRDRSIAGYVHRLAKKIDEPAIIVNHIQAGSWRVFSRSLELLAPLHARLGMPIGGAQLDLFAGTYERSPLGVHKDEQDVFTFVLEGRKRFLVWPFETFRVGAKRDAPHVLDDVEPDAMRHRAIVLEAGPRDLVYWPASAWHYAESDGGFTATLALGTFPRAVPLHLVDRIARELRLRDETFTSDADTSRALRDVLASRAGKEAETVVLETWRSAFGYARVPRLARRKLGDTVRIDRPESLRWVEEHDRIMICASGHLLRVPRHRAIVALLARLKKGGPVKVTAAGDLDASAVRYILGFLASTATLR